MNPFKTRFNRLVFSLVLVVAFYFGSLMLVCVCGIFLHWNKDTSHIFSDIIPLFPVGGFAFAAMQTLLLRSKTYTISEDGIEQKNVLNRKRRNISKTSIRGFSTSQNGRIKQVILYLENGKKLELVKFSFWNFEHIQEALQSRGYHYFGYEPYKIDWRFRRVYQFDDIVSEQTKL